MSSVKHRRRSGYGAHELKATYQRNMLAGMVVVIGAALLVLVTGAIASRLTVPEKEGSEVGRDTVLIVIDLGPKLEIVRDQPKVGVKSLGRNQVTGAEGYVPVSDHEAPDFIVDVLPAIPDLGVPVFGEPGREGEAQDGSGGGSSGSSTSQEPRMGEFIKAEIMPEMYYEHKPEYPQLVRKAGIEGTVWIWAAIDEQGQVTKAQVSKTSGNKALDEAALKAAYLCLYSPGIQNGRPVKVAVTYKVEFVLDQRHGR